MWKYVEITGSIVRVSSHERRFFQTNVPTEPLSRGEFAHLSSDIEGSE